MPSLRHETRAPSPWGGTFRGRIGILGGSFNPAHEGHLHISQDALKRLNLRQVWWLVSPQNPLKPRTGMAPVRDRLGMALSLARDPRIRVCDLESTFRSRFAVDSVRTLKIRFPRVRFVWLVGADNMAQIIHWHRWTCLFHMVPIAVFDRDGYARRAVMGRAARRFSHRRVDGPRLSGLVGRSAPAWAFVPIRRHGASSTALRNQGRWP